MYNTAVLGPNSREHQKEILDENMVIIHTAEYKPAPAHRCPRGEQSRQHHSPPTRQQRRHGDAHDIRSVSTTHRM